MILSMSSLLPRRSWAKKGPSPSVGYLDTDLLHCNFRTPCYTYILLRSTYSVFGVKFVYNKDFFSSVTFILNHCKKYRYKCLIIISMKVLRNNSYILWWCFIYITVWLCLVLKSNRASVGCMEYVILPIIVIVTVRFSLISNLWVWVCVITFL